MESVLRHYERVAKSSKKQAPHASDHEVNTIGRCDMEIRADTCCACKNCRLLSTTGQLCDVKVFHHSYESINNVSVGGAAIAVVYDDETVYILILN